MSPGTNLPHPAAGFHHNWFCPDFKKNPTDFCLPQLKRHHYNFIPASHTDREREYNTFKQLIVYHYHALFYIKPSVYEGKKRSMSARPLFNSSKKKKSVLVISAAVPPTGSPTQCYLSHHSAIMHMCDVGPKHKLQSKL